MLTISSFPLTSHSSTFLSSLVVAPLSVYPQGRGRVGGPRWPACSQTHTPPRVLPRQPLPPVFAAFSQGPPGTGAHSPTVGQRSFPHCPSPASTDLVAQVLLGGLGNLHTRGPHSIHSPPRQHGTAGTHSWDQPCPWLSPWTKQIGELLGNHVVIPQSLTQPSCIPGHTGPASPATAPILLAGGTMTHCFPSSPRGYFLKSRLWPHGPR